MRGAIKQESRSNSQGPSDLGCLPLYMTRRTQGAGRRINPARTKIHGPQDAGRRPNPSHHLYTGPQDAGHRSSNLGFPTLFPRQTKIHHRSRARGARKNSHHYSVNVPNATRFVTCSPKPCCFLLFLIQAIRVSHSGTYIHQACPHQSGSQFSDSGSFSVGVASIRSTVIVLSLASSTLFISSKADGYCFLIAASRAVISSRLSLSSWWT